MKAFSYLTKESIQVDKLYTLSLVKMTFATHVIALLCFDWLRSQPQTIQQKQSINPYLSFSTCILSLATLVSYIKTDCLRFCSAACLQYQHSAAECEAVTRLPVPRPHMSTWLMTLRLHLVTRLSRDTRADLVSLLAGLEDDDTQKIRYLFK